MEDSSHSNTSEIFNDNFLYNWLPNSEEMLQQTLNNKNFIYYPSVSSDSFKVFDITSQKGNVDADDEFVAIDQKTASTAPKTKTKTQQQQQQTKKAQPAAKKGYNIKGAGYQSYQTGPKLKVPQTIQLQADWKVIADFNKQSLEKLKLDGDLDVEDKLICGQLHKISEDYEKDTINPLNPTNLKRFDNFKFFGNISTLEDEKLKAGASIANVLITDKILAVIMTSISNSRPWHIKITKVGESIFIDKMHNSEIDLATVNESSDNMPPDDDDKNINSFKNLAIEATLINEFIKEQIIDPEIKLDDESEVPVESHPFNDDSAQDVERLCYKYRLWRVGDIDVLVRCQVHAFDENEKGDNILVNVFALNEFDKNNFKSTEHQSMSQHLRKELPNNFLKITKWGVLSYLGGVENIKVGFVSRKNTKANDSHSIFGFLDVKLNDLLNVTNFNYKTAWGIFKQIIEIVKNQQDGTFVLMKTLAGPKPMVKLIKLPPNVTLDVEEETEF